MCNIYSKLSCHENYEGNQSSSVCSIPRTRTLFWTDRQMMSNAIVADRLLADKATNNSILVKQLCSSVSDIS